MKSDTVVGALGKIRNSRRSTDGDMQSDCTTTDARAAAYNLQMPLIIDANNLLHTTMPQPLAGLDETRLCALLARGPWAGDHVTVVCDGAGSAMDMRASPSDAVDLRFAGHSRTADDVIIAMIDADSAPRRLVVVSNDREIRRAARRRRARAWSCEMLIGELARTAATSDRAVSDRPADQPLDRKQVDHWLEQFGVDGDKPIDPDEPQRRPWDFELDDELD